MDSTFHLSRVIPSSISPSYHFPPTSNIQPQVLPKFQGLRSPSDIKIELPTSYGLDPHMKHPASPFSPQVATESSSNTGLKINEPSFYRDYCNKRHDYQSSEVDLQLQTAIQKILNEFESRKHVATHGTSSTAKRKRASSEQLQILKQVFEYTFFPSTELRNELSRVLGMTPRAVQVWFQNKRQSWKSTRGKNPNSKRSTSPCAIQNLQTTRFNSPNLSPPLSNERLVANRTPLLDSDLPLTPPKKRRFSVEIGLEATVLRHQSPSLPGTNSSQQSTYLEPLAPLRTLSTVAPQQFLEIAPNSFPRSCKLPSLMEMGIDFRSSVRGSF